MNIKLDETLLSVGKKIKRERRKKGMSQSGLALATGIQKASLSRIEAGKINVTIKTLVTICNALGISF